MLIDWSVLVAEPQKTRLVAENLTARAIDFFIPTEHVTSIRNGRKVVHERPVLGRYVLYAVTEGWKSLSTMRGVSGLMLAHDYEKDSVEPALVNVDQLKILRDFCDDSKNRQKEVSGGFIYDQRVTPKAGPFAMRVGRYAGKGRKGRDEAIFTLFGQDQKVLFKAGELIAA